jgi:hypothetical protein
MHHHVGVIIGVVIGISVEADGIDGIIVQFQHLRHCQLINGSIQVIGTQNRWSSNVNYISKIIIFSHAIL